MLLQEIVDQQRNIFLAFAKGSERDLRRIQPQEKLFAKCAAFYVRLQVA